MSAVESKVECPYCQGHVAFPSEMSGQAIACPHCGQGITLPTVAQNSGQPDEPLYRIRINTDEIGPYPLAGLCGLLADGVITLATPIVPADGGDWMPLGDLLPPDASARGSSRPPPPSPGSRQPPLPPIRGIAFNDFPGIALSITGNSAISNRIESCYFGVRTDGRTARPNGVDGIRISGGARSNTIGGPDRGNVISGNASAGVYLTDSATTENRVSANFIGTDAGGTIRIANGTEGVVLAGAVGNFVGGVSPAERNVISGNAYRGIWIGAGAASNVIAGNWIGLDATGQRALANGYEGIALVNDARGNVIGGTVTGAGNVVSGNATTGIWLGGGAVTDNRIEGNFVGLNAAGSAALSNRYDGVTIQLGASGNSIGGTNAGARNILSGNGYYGVSLYGATTTDN